MEVLDDEEVEVLEDEVAAPEKSLPESKASEPETRVPDLDRRNTVADALRRSNHAFNIYIDALVVNGEMAGADL